MKRKITLLLLAASSVLTMSSQVILSEEFTSPFNPATTGWVVQNLSSPSGTVSWTQGNGTGGNGTSTAYSGGTNDFYCADFLSVAANSAGGINAWLITPPVSIYNGAVLQFATRTLNQTTPNIFPDRLQVRMATTNNTVIAASPTTAVGAFSQLLLDINPSLSTTNASVVTGANPGIVNGFPMAWTVYTIQITSAPSGTTTGRFAFRYFVDNGGQTGANSRFVGIDQFKYTGPCGTSALSYTTCANQAVTLNADGGLASTTYSWSGPSGFNASTQAITVNAPASGAAVYTLYPANGSTLCGNSQTASITVASNMAVNITASNNNATICSGRTVTLTAYAPATSYAWNTSPILTTSIITVTPQVTTTYSVGALAGNFCAGGNSVTINVIPSPTISYAISPTVVCTSSSGMTVTASGASTYTYVLASSTPTTNPLTNISVPTTAGLYNFQVFGTAPNGCINGGTATFSVFGTPTVNVTSSAAAGGTIICANNTVALTADGASTYTFAQGATTSTSNPYTYGSLTTNLTTGTKIFTITAIDENGCSATIQYQLRVAACTGIESIEGNADASIYPNPFTNELKISDVNGTVEIFNALGQVVVRSVVNDSQSLNTTDLTKGVYILKAYNKEGAQVKTVKLIKN